MDEKHRERENKRHRFLTMRVEPLWEQVSVYKFATCARHVNSGLVMGQKLEIVS